MFFTSVKMESNHDVVCIVPASQTNYVMDDAVYFSMNDEFSYADVIEQALNWSVSENGGMINVYGRSEDNDNWQLIETVFA